MLFRTTISFLMDRTTEKNALYVKTTTAKNS